MYKYFLGLKFLFSRPINLLGIVGVAVAVWAMLLIVSIFSGYIREVRRHIRSVASDISLIGYDLDVSYSEVEKFLREEPGVRASAPRMVWYGMIFARNKPAAGAMPPPGVARGRPGKATGSNFYQVIGVDLEKEVEVSGILAWLNNVADEELRVEDPKHPFRHRIRNGSDAAELPGMLLGVDRAKEAGLRRGSRITMSTGRRLENGEVNPIRQDFVLSGVFNSKHWSFEENTILIHIDVLRRMFGQDPENGGLDFYHEVSIALREGNQPAAVAERLNARSNRLHLRLGAFVTWQKRQDRFLQSVEHQRGLMRLVLLILLVVAAFLIYATLSMMVTEKTRDIGVLSALGATRSGVLSVFLFCGLAIAVLGTLIGMVSTYYSCIHLNDFNSWLMDRFGIELFRKDIYHLKEVPYEMDLSEFLIVGAGALVMSLLFSLLPAWRAARLDAAVALRRE